MIINQNLDNKQIRTLQLLDKKCLSCSDCNLNENKRVKPYWFPSAKYAMVIGSADEFDKENKKLISGIQSIAFWKILAENHLTRKDFLIIPSTICRVIHNGKQNDPSEYHRKCCRKWLKTYLTILNPSKILVFGNFALHTLTGEWWNRKTHDKFITNEKITGKKIKCIKSMHHYSFLMSEYNEKMLRKSLKEFNNE